MPAWYQQMKIEKRKKFVVEKKLLKNFIKINPEIMSVSNKSKKSAIMQKKKQQLKSELK